MLVCWSLASMFAKYIWIIKIFQEDRRILDHGEDFTSSYGFMPCRNSQWVLNNFFVIFHSCLISWSKRQNVSVLNVMQLTHNTPVKGEGVLFGVKPTYFHSTWYVLYGHI